MAVSVRGEERLVATGSAGAIEISFHPGNREGAGFGWNYVGLVCHPHPLYGGTMDNKVVTTLVRSYIELGISAARFNFRGVGGSEGVHDTGHGEAGDLLSVLDRLRGLMNVKGVVLAGFSFGAYVAAAACHNIEDIKHLTLVAPPVNGYTFEKLDRFPCPLCVIMGDRDELVEPDRVYRWIDELDQPCELVRFAEASHFFHGHLPALRTELQQALLRQLI